MGEGYIDSEVDDPLLKNWLVLRVVEPALKKHYVERILHIVMCCLVYVLCDISNSFSSASCMHSLST